MDPEYSTSRKALLSNLRHMDMHSTHRHPILIFKHLHVIGIFSRSYRSDYSWLENVLSSQGMNTCLIFVQSFVITNAGRQPFRDKVSKCNFAILYHTLNYGRINITDVPGSLYDEELEYLSKELGKNKVLVVLDDLDDSSSEEKMRILQNQPSIGRLAKDLVLFSKTDKTNDLEIDRRPQN